MDEKKSYQSKQLNHNIIIEGREKMSISAVDEVGAFDENSVTLNTAAGYLEISGSGLHINKLSVETGDVEIEGKITGCVYKERDKASGTSFMGRLFK